jgi:DNA-binding transcriptional regulator YiaG
VTRTDEWKKHISESIKNKYETNLEYKEKHKSAMKTKKYKEEASKRFKEKWKENDNFSGNKGKKLSEKTKEKMKNSSHKGSNHHFSKLNEEKVLEIRKLKKETNLTNQKIADMFGVSRTVIGKIILRKLWVHI